MNFIDFLTETITGVTIQITVMLSIAFFLGYMLTRSSIKKWKSEAHKYQNNWSAIQIELDKLKKKSTEFEANYLNISNELRKTNTLLKRTKTNMGKLKEEHKTLLAATKDWEGLKLGLTTAKRKITRLEKIKEDQKEQIDKLQRALLSSRVEASKKPSNGVSKKNGKPALNMKDDLTKIHGIGPKIQSILHNHGIQTFTDLGKTGIKQLKSILLESGKNIKAFDPKLWSKQAKLIKSEKWKELDTLLKN